MQTVPGFIGQAGYQHPPELLRNLTEAMFGRSGVVNSGDFALSTGVGTRAVAVAPGHAILVGTENSTQGAYYCWETAAETKLLAAATTNPRIDTFLIRVEDSQYGTISGQPEAYVDVVQGVAAASPTARPDSDFNAGGSFYIPGAWLRIGDVRVNVGDASGIPTGQITNFRRAGRRPGEPNQCTSTTRPTVGMVDGDLIYETDTRQWKSYNSALASWQIIANSGSWTTHNSGLVSVSGFVQGSTTFEGLYKVDNRSCHYLGKIAINTGGGFNPGSGNWTFPLPVTPLSTSLGGGWAWANDSGTAIRPGVMYMDGTAAPKMFLDGGILVSSSGPGSAWLTGDSLAWGIEYPIA